MIGYYAAGVGLEVGAVDKVEARVAGAGEAAATGLALDLAATASALSAGTSSRTRWVSVAWI